MPDSDPHPSHSLTTEWSVVLRAKAWAPELPTVNRERADAALRYLCEKYDKPVFAFLRAKGFPDDVAEDLRNSFHAEVLSHDRAWKNLLRNADDSHELRFRQFLFQSLKDFVGDWRRKASAGKRGGQHSHVSLDVGEEPATREKDSAAFDRMWAREIVSKSIEKTFLGYDEHRAEALKGYLDGTAPSYAETATQLGMSENGVKQAVKRLRAQFMLALRAQIGETVASPQQIDVEWKHLKSALEKIEHS